MELNRTTFQGVSNIVRFNWHFYVIAALGLMAMYFYRTYLPEPLQAIVLLLAGLAILTIVVSLLISYYIYDLSDLYKLSWLENTNYKSILNINAGFDETSQIIETKYPDAKLSICDFYDPKKHTEVSIRRARKAYPPHAKTIQTSTEKLSFDDQQFDISLAILSAHEIRNKEERIQFFLELNRVTKQDGYIYVTEHLRDINNFVAYTIGFLHFHSHSTWLSTFESAQLEVVEKIKTTPFITTYKLKKHGTAS